MFIVFEGIDGCGKSTQSKMLRMSLEEAGQEVACVQNPGSTLLGTELRPILLGSRIPLTPEAEALLFAAGTAQLAHLITGELAAGRVVICDRWTMSGLAYQGHGRGRSLDGIRLAHCNEVLNLQPDFTFVLDLDVSAAADRVGKSRERFESAGFDFYERVRAGFLVESVGNTRTFNHNPVMLNGADPAIQLHMKILRDVLNLIQSEAEAGETRQEFLRNIEAMMTELPYVILGKPKREDDDGKEEERPEPDQPSDAPVAPGATEPGPTAAVPSISPRDVGVGKELATGPAG